MSINARKRKRQAGFTILEVMIAGVVLIVGLLAISGLFATVVGNNGRSRIDSTATMLSQSVIEQITAVLARGGPPQLTDCTGTTFTINTGVGGAKLNGASIDFTETTPPAGYWMQSNGKTGFTIGPGNANGSCAGGGEAGTTATYDVRWNVQFVSCATAPQCPQTYLVTVAARPMNMRATRFTFSLPVTLRAYVGSE